VNLEMSLGAGAQRAQANSSREVAPTLA